MEAYSGSSLTKYAFSSPPAPKLHTWGTSDSIFGYIWGASDGLAVLRFVSGSGGLHRNELHGHHGRKRSILDSGGGERRSRDSDLLGSHKVGDIAKVAGGGLDRRHTGKRTNGKVTTILRRRFFFL